MLDELILLLLYSFDNLLLDIYDFCDSVLRLLIIVDLCNSRSNHSNIILGVIDICLIDSEGDLLVHLYLLNDMIYLFSLNADSLLNELHLAFLYFFHL